MRINHNLAALSAFNSYTSVNNALSKSINKLSTGLRINSAADDAAGLAISEKMRAQISGLDQAVSNSQDGISMLQTAEGALEETTSILQRMRELSVQAANDTLTQQDRSYIQLEVDQLREEVDRIATTTQFNKKNLLDGSASVLWSSDTNDTTVYVRGGLKSIDQFGQKVVTEGNYKVTIDANPGDAQIQKTDIFKIKHENVLSGVNLDDDYVTDVSVDNLPAANYNVNAESLSAGTVGGGVNVQQTFNFASGAVATTTAAITNGFAGTANILLEITNIDTQNGVMTIKATAVVLSANGASQTFVKEGLQMNSSNGIYWTAFGLSKTAGALLTMNTAFASINSTVAVGGKMVLNVLCSATGVSAADVTVKVSGTMNTSWDGYWNALSAGLVDVSYNVQATALANKDVHFRNFYLNTGNGTVYQSDIVLGFTTAFATGGAGSAVSAAGASTNIATFKATYVGQTAQMDTQLRDIDKFWDANGTFMLDDAKTITITQGDGKKTDVTLYSTDTISDVASKLNDAVANGLGQAVYLDTSDENDASKFVTYVQGEKSDTSEAVEGTFVIRSILGGANGEISFAGDEKLLNALSLNTIQESSENTYYVSVQDAHTGEPIANNMKITGNTAIGILHENLDFSFKATADMSIKWNEDAKRYDINSMDTSSYETIIHVADNTTTLQIGANEGEDMLIDIAEMGSEALGINSVLVTDQASASRSITIIDNALDRVASQRAKLGAYQNRLEHTINNLTVAGENLTSAESRIRDVDMAEEMMNFTKLNILSQASTSMLGQANQITQNVLSLMG